MIRKIGFITVAGLATLLISACGSQNDGLAAAPAPTVQALDTEQVLVLARQSSEISSPFQVDDGVLMLTDTSDASKPVDVNLM